MKLKALITTVFATGLITALIAVPSALAALSVQVVFTDGSSQVYTLDIDPATPVDQIAPLLTLPEGKQVATIVKLPSAGDDIDGGSKEKERGKGKGRDGDKGGPSKERKKGGKAKNRKKRRKNKRDGGSRNRDKKDKKEPGKKEQAQDSGKAPSGKAFYSLDSNYVPFLNLGDLGGLTGYDMPLALAPVVVAAADRYGLDPALLMAILLDECGFEAYPCVSSAGALGPTQFMPGTWKSYGVDANKDLARDPFHYIDAIFSSANYLSASGAPKKLKQAIFSYNHSDVYVADILKDAQNYSRFADVTQRLAQLLDNFYPVHGDAQHQSNKEYALIKGAAGAPVVAVTDSRVEQIKPTSSGYDITLVDSSGNSFIYRGLKSISNSVPVLDLKKVATKAQATAKAKASKGDGKAKPTITAHTATPSRYVEASDDLNGRRKYANPYRKNNVAHSAELGQLPDTDKDGQEGAMKVYLNDKVKALAPDSFSLKPLALDLRLTPGVKIGELGKDGARFEVRLANKDNKSATAVDPGPMLDIWSTLQREGLAKANGYTKAISKGKLTPEQVLVMDRDELKEVLLNDPKISFYPGAKEEIKDDVIATYILRDVAYLEASGLGPLSISSFKRNHSPTVAGSSNYSAHFFGRAVDISVFKGKPVIGNQGAGTPIFKAIEKLLTKEEKPAQLISLMDLDGDKGTVSFPMGNHDDHLHDGYSYGGGSPFSPSFKLDAQAWNKLMQIASDGVVVKFPKRPTKASLPDNASGSKQ